MNQKRTLFSLQRYAEMNGYADLKQLLEEAKDANAVFEFAGANHIHVEAMEVHLQKMAALKLSKPPKQGKTLADTRQFGIIKSNLKRLPVAIEKKERRLKSVEALLASATTDSEKLSLRNERNVLKNALKQHRENLKLAQAAHEKILKDRSAALAVLESEESERLNQEKQVKK